MENIGKNSDRKALITGGSNGIGLAIVEKYLACGFNVIAHYHTSDENLVKITSDRLQCVSGDFSTIENIEEFTARLERLAPSIDVVINNAARYSNSYAFDRVSIEEIEHMFSVNFVAPLQIIRKVLPSMRRKRWGRVVNISSIGVVHGGSLGSFHYTASKSALESLTKSIALDVANDNVLANVLRVGVTDTTIHKKNIKKNLNKRIARIPMKRMAATTEIANFAYFLGSNQNTFSTGSIHTISGGE